MVLKTNLLLPIQLSCVTGLLCVQESVGACASVSLSIFAACVCVGVCVAPLSLRLNSFPVPCIIHPRLSPCQA